MKGHSKKLLTGPMMKSELNQNVFSLDLKLEVTRISTTENQSKDSLEYDFKHLLNQNISSP